MRGGFYPDSGNWQSVFALADLVKGNSLTWRRGKKGKLLKR